jgi:hypothetical protein
MTQQAQIAASSVPGATVGAAHLAPLSRGADRGPEHHLPHQHADHVVEFHSRVFRALRNSADHAAKMVRKADAARRS